MREEVPPPLIDAHLKAVEKAFKEGKRVDPNYGLDKTGIAGTEANAPEAQASTSGQEAEGKKAEEKEETAKAGTKEEEGEEKGTEGRQDVSARHFQPETECFICAICFPFAGGEGREREGD